MKVLLFGATGMVGSGALLECLEDPRVHSVVVVGRSPCGTRHAKLREILHADFFDFSAIQSGFAGVDACFFCLGVSSAGLPEPEYRRITFDLTLAAARAMVAVNAAVTFCYVSGAGTDSTERGRTMWARVKGQTENALLAMPFKAAFMFRPAFIQPVKGVRTKTPLYRAFYAILGPLFPVLRRLAPRHVTTSAAVGRALIEVAIGGYDRRILASEDINRVANRTQGAADNGP
jgi:uncharacterized protein YbjT (DUF2867 family)